MNKPIPPIEYALSAERLEEHRAFLERYRTIRRREERGADRPEFYLRLPEGDFDGDRAKEWRIRAESLAWLREHLARRSADGSLAVLDAGAGNCWMTRYLAEWGHQVTALDLNDDDYDGLGSGRHYLERLPISFRRVVADFAQLPFADDSFDLIICNGALHYAADPLRVVAEFVRILGEGGEIVLIDTPVYRDAKSGEKMLAARVERGGAGYLTFDLLESIAAGLQLDLHSYPRPSSLFKRLKRKLLELRLRREIASMPWIVFRKRR